ncbi:conserved uncharacterized WD40 domain-containing protein [Desulfosarcina variabilis str. Montpellier]|uniref:TolB family protein n=1 Tax=Desulfosarcina variabilis TaxID=2300 RepID=UPI003AFAAAA8
MEAAKRITGLLVLMVAVLTNCTFTGHSGYSDQQDTSAMLSLNDQLIWQKRIAGRNPPHALKALTITSPDDGALFPPEFAAPTFCWADTCEASTHWLVVLRFGDAKDPLMVISRRPQWTPERSIWDTIKARSTANPAEVTVFGVCLTPVKSITSQGRIQISTSTDRVGAAIFYRQVPLPFPTGKKAVQTMKWRLGDIASYDAPPVVMENISTCAGCHLFSSDGRLISMEMNYKNDSGAHVIAPVEKHIALSANGFMTWRDFPKPDLLPPTRGTFAKLSSSGKTMVGTVNEISFFALTNDPAFCQLFFPTYGILAWYDVASRTLHGLPGADDIDFVQTDPSWSPDEKTIVFARTEKRNTYHADITNVRTRIIDADIHALNKKYPIQFDLYRMAFNNGRGGVPQPLEGASNNGMSNYFARYTPDGRWIVFTRSRSGIMLQPDSELFIVSASGGTPRRMHCNRDRFNSWHSFSPNGRWMLFTSKVNSDYTEIFLTHIHENGMDSVPVCLSRFSDARMAANVPEFVNLPANAIRRITPAAD